MRHLKQLLPLAILSFTAKGLFAQNLPNVQNKDLLAPSNIKIDGNPIEWGSKYMAYNHTNYMFYSMANDADNLYLLVHINDRVTIQKVLFGGITLTIDAPKSEGSDQKKDGANVKLKFPVPTDIFQEVQKDFLPFSGSGVLYKDILDTSKTSKGKRDSTIIILNRKLENMFKEIELAGIKDIGEPLLSIYNTNGIKVAARFNEQLQYTYEMAIPLRFLNADINNGVKFKYNIVVNGKPTSVKTNGVVVPIPVGVSFGDAPPDATEFYLYSATSFSGKYTLIKK